MADPAVVVEKGPLLRPKPSELVQSSRLLEPLTLPWFYSAGTGFHVTQ